MKNLLYAILLMLPCVSISQDLPQQSDSTLIVQSSYPPTYKWVKIPLLQEVLKNGNGEETIHFVSPNETSNYWHLKGELSEYKPLTLQPEQVFNVYVGLKQLEHYKSAYTECAKAVDSLNSIVIEQDYNLNDLVRQMQDYNTQLTQLYKEREALLTTKPKRTLWWLYAAGGLLTGILIAK